MWLSIRLNNLKAGHNSIEQKKNNFTHGQIHFFLSAFSGGQTPHIKGFNNSFKHFKYVGHQFLQYFILQNHSKTWQTSHPAFKKSMLALRTSTFSSLVDYYLWTNSNSTMFTNLTIRHRSWRYWDYRASIHWNYYLHLETCWCQKGVA